MLWCQCAKSRLLGHCEGTRGLLALILRSYRLTTNMIPESIMDSSFSVFAVSNMGRIAKLTIKRSFRAVLWTDEQDLLASNRLSCCGIVFREPYLFVNFELEREKVWKLKW